LFVSAEEETMNDQSARHKIIIDSDFGLMNDDSTATMFALQTPELDVLGITLVAGNFDLNESVEDALRILELIGREEIPVCAGFDRPLVHERQEYENRVWGKWATFMPPEPPFGEFAKKRPDSRHAVDFIIEKILEYPNEVTLVAVGPLTNVAVAIRKAPEIVDKVKEIVIMGGAIAILPRGHGNITPSAEFNFWVDPEAAWIVMRSGAPIYLVPLNVCRMTTFKEEYYKRIVSVDTPITRLFKAYLGEYFENPELEKQRARIYYGMYDHLAVLAVFRRDLLTAVRMHVDIDLNRGYAYGASYGFIKGSYQSGGDQFPALEDTREVSIAYEVDFDKFVDIYLNALTRV
jgi:inosine-uridine nucleoside N-ribohydrolase